MFNYIYYKLGVYIANRLSLKGAYAFARFISDLHFIYSRADRVAVLNNLRIILPNKRGIHRIALEVFRNFGIYLVDFFRTQKLDKEAIAKKVKIINLECVDEALRKGKGVIVVSAHMCNWELASFAMGFSDYPISVVAYPHRDKRINDFFNYQRESKGIEVIPVGKAARKCIENLKANKIIALVGDREFTQSGLIIDFFGKETLIPKGPATLSILTGATIIMGFAIKEKEDKIALIFEKLIEPERTGDKEKDIFNLTRKFLNVIENYIRQYPGQWLMFRKFWL